MKAYNLGYCWQIMKIYNLVARYISASLFRGIPESYPINKKLNLLMANSYVFYLWDFIIVLLSLLASGLYVAETYTNHVFDAVQAYHNADTVITSFFTVDFCLGLVHANTNILRFLFSPTTLIDLMTFLPYYVQLVQQERKVNLAIFRFLKIYRMIRIIRVFRALNSISGVKRQAWVVIITFFCLVFIGAGLVQLMENDVKQLMEYQCNFIGPATFYQPSCTETYLSSSSISCDCFKRHCKAFYNYFDERNEPSGIRCVQWTYFQSAYFVVVTVSTLGKFRLF